MAMFTQSGWKRLLVLLTVAGFWGILFGSQTYAQQANEIEGVPAECVKALSLGLTAEETQALESADVQRAYGIMKSLGTTERDGFLYDMIEYSRLHPAIFSFSADSTEDPRLVAINKKLRAEVIRGAALGAFPGRTGGAGVDSVIWYRSPLSAPKLQNRSDTPVSNPVIKK